MDVYTHGLPTDTAQHGAGSGDTDRDMRGKVKRWKIQRLRIWDK